MKKNLKCLANLVVLIAAAMFAFSATGCDSSSPAEQADAFLAQVKVGMAWEAVAKIKEPRKLIIISPKAVGGYSNPIKFERAKFEKDLADKKFAHGFAFRYAFSPDRTHRVVFNVEGKVKEVNKVISKSDLLKPGGYRP